MILNEFSLIQHISSLISTKSDKRLVCGIGDDCAVLDYGTNELVLVSTDSFNEEVHFSRSFSNFEDVGIKATAGAVSDIYAMAGTCRHLFVSIAVPSNMNQRLISQFYSGVKQVADFCHAKVVGGDTTSAVRFFSTTITVVGTAKRGCVKYRSGAKPGDWIYLTGQPGYSQAGLCLLKKGIRKGSTILNRALIQHRRPLPYFYHHSLFQSRKITSLIDVSDGLSSELNHLAMQSNLTFRITIEPLIKDVGLQTLAKLLNVNIRDLVLSSGEEYLLLCTSKSRIRVPGFLEIGRVEQGRASVLLDGEVLSSSGFNHFSSHKE